MSFAQGSQRYYLPLTHLFMKLRFTLFTLFVFFSAVSFAQMQVVIMGSSTAYGVGASSYDNSWAGKITSYLNRNVADGRDTVVHNIAFPGYDTYQEMPTGFVPPVGRPIPDEDFNVTKALSFNPDVVIINLPSNDINYGYAKSEMINNLRTMSAAIFANGTTRCYVTTPQPRNDLDPNLRDSLRAMVDSINLSFGPYAIDFWTGLVISDGSNMLKEEYRAAPSPLHVNDLGHNLLFEKIRDSYIFGLAGPVALRLTNFSAQLQNQRPLLTWHVEEQPANTSFEIQRSGDGRTFTTISTLNIIEARQSFNYSFVDPTNLASSAFYRIRVVEVSGRVAFSPVINLQASVKPIAITSLYTDNSGNNLGIVVHALKSQPVDIQLVGPLGNVLYKQKLQLNAASNNLTIPIPQLAAGQYFLRISSADGGYAVKAFRK